MSISRFIFRAIHEGRWLSIEYVNAENKTTYYWISISDIKIVNRDGVDRAKLVVMGLHLKTMCALSRDIFDGLSRLKLLRVLMRQASLV